MLSRSQTQLRSLTQSMSCSSSSSSAIPKIQRKIQCPAQSPAPAALYPISDPSQNNHQATVHCRSQHHPQTAKSNIVVLRLLIHLLIMQSWAVAQVSQPCSAPEECPAEPECNVRNDTPELNNRRRCRGWCAIEFPKMYCSAKNSEFSKCPPQLHLPASS